MPPCIVLCGVLGWMVSASGQTQPHSLSVDVEPIGSDRAINTTGSTHTNANVTYWSGGHLVDSVHSTEMQTTKEAKSIEITVRNFGQLPDSAQVQWYFVSVPAKVDSAKPRNEQESIFDEGQQSVSLNPGATQIFDVKSKDVISELKKKSSGFVSKRGKIDPTGSGKKTTGRVFEGWMVRVTADGRVIDSRGSDGAFSDIAKDDARFNVLKGQ